MALPDPIVVDHQVVAMDSSLTFDYPDYDVKGSVSVVDQAGTVLLDEYIELQLGECKNTTRYSVLRNNVKNLLNSKIVIGYDLFWELELLKIPLLDLSGVIDTADSLFLRSELRINDEPAVQDLMYLIDGTNDPPRSTCERAKLYMELYKKYKGSLGVVKYNYILDTQYAADNTVF